MKIRHLDGVNVRISTRIKKSEIDEEIKKLAAKTAKSVRLPGFRPGKVPVAAVIKRYGAELGQDAQNNLIKEILKAALKELKKDEKDLVGQPYFEKFEEVGAGGGEVVAGSGPDTEVGAGGDAAAAGLVGEPGFELDFILSFRPIFSVEDYESLVPSFELEAVSEAELEARRGELLRRFATPEAVARPLARGDVAKFDFEGFIDGEAFEGGRAENYSLEIGSGQFIPGFEDGMLGMSAGEERELAVKFPADYGVEKLAGKEASFRVKLHEASELKTPKLDEELLKKALPGEANPTPALLDERLKEQLRTEKLAKLMNEELKAKFTEALIAHYDFDLPRGVVEQELALQFQNAARAFSREESEELRADPAKLTARREEFRQEAQKSVKLTFIVDELARLKKIEASEAELIQAIYFEAYRHGLDPQEHLQNYKNNNALPAIKMAIIEEKLFNEIFTHVAKKAAEKNEEKSGKKAGEPAKK